MNKKQILAIEEKGFSVADLNSIVDGDNVNGVIIKDGSFILCSGFNEHRYVYPFLYNLGLVDSPDWVDDNSTVHVSSCQIHGRVAHDMSNKATQAQLDTLFTLRRVLGSYSGHESITAMLYECISSVESNGGKYNGLKFLQRFYPNVRLPKFSKRAKDMASKSKVCIRTSPVHSMPGLLSSKFNVKPDQYKTTIKEIVKDFNKYSSLVEYNDIHYFFQEQLSGVNGVCNVRGERGERVFSYDASVIQGDIVRGKRGRIVLQDNIVQELKSVAIELSNDMDRSIQLEFVVSGSKLYIVQFRVLKNEPEDTVVLTVPNKAICFGKTFSRGRIDVDAKDILVVDKDGESSLLIGKKALIVTSNVEFSHLLALSKALRIPSMYATGKVKLRGKVNFVAYNKKSWIL